MKISKRKMMGSLAVVLALFTTLALLVGCGGIGGSGGGDNASGDSGNQSASSGDTDAGGVDGLPASFTAYDNSYTIDSYTIEINDEGNTVVKCEGSGFSVLPMRNGSFRLPLSCVLMVDGAEQSWISGSASGSGIEFEYDGVFEPEALIFTAADDESQRVEIQVA